MQYLPVCNYEGHFWPKKKQLFYVAIGRGNDFERYRLRFCPAHAADVDQDLTEREMVVTQLTLSAGQGYHPRCLTGGEPLSESWRQVFITGYPTQDERKDYWGNLCYEHELPEYLIDNYIPRAA